MQFDATETLGALAKLPPETPKPVEAGTTAGGLWRAVRNAVPAAAAESLAMVAKGASIAFDDSPDNRGPVRQFGEEVERSLRNVAESYGPDPMTASKAEQVVFGLTRGVGKAVGYGLTTGPAAPFLFGADEGLTEREKLLRQGVDEATATKVGALAGAVNVAGFAIPAAGSTVAKTIGLATLSGPASFVAQQAGSREILRNADYESIASSYDPTDALGLGLSAIPFGFGAWAMRGRFKSAKPAPEAAPIQDPRTTAPDAIPVEPVRAADELGVSPDIAQATPDVAARGPDAGAAAPNAAESAPVRAPAQDLAPADGAAGVADSRPTPEPAAPFIPHEAVDAAMVHNLTLAAERAGNEKPISGLPKSVQSDIADALYTQGHDTPDPKWLDAWEKSGRDLDLFTPEAVAAEAELAGLTFSVEAVDPQAVGNLGRLTSARIVDQYAAMRAESAPPPILIRRDETGAAHVVEGGHRLAAAKAAGAKSIDAVDITELLNVDAQALLGRPVESQPQPIKETPADVPTPEKLGTETREAPAPEGKAEVGKAAEGAADAATVAVYKSEAERILETNPDMVVDVDAQGNKVTAREALEKIRREAAEGTATELGADDAKLVKVAAECALSFGD